METLLTGLVSAAATAVITYFVTLSKIRLDLAVEYDKKLRAERLDAYKKLFTLLKPLARYSPAEQITDQIIKRTSENMRDWYFDIGGIYLSQKSREHYFALKESMQKVIDKPTLLDTELKNILKHGKVLRESLSNDVGTRAESFM